MALKEGDSQMFIKIYNTVVILYVSIEFFIA